MDGLSLRTFGMVIAGFQVEDKFSRAPFFQESFLLAETGMEVFLKLPSLTLNNTDIQLQKKSLLRGPILPLRF